VAQIADIISYISDKYKSEANIIEAEARKRYDEHIAKAESRAQIEYDAIISKAKTDSARRIEMAQSSAKQLEAREILKIKNESVDLVLLKTRQKILDLDDKSYEQLLISFLKKYREDKKGEIILSSSDKERNLKNFEKEALSYGLEISRDTADISGGFILKYGNVEENCSIDAVLKEKKEQLTDYINSNLFK